VSTCEDYYESGKFNFEEVNELVRTYHEAPDKATQALYRDKILRCFHRYFMKYVGMLKGYVDTMYSSDTRQFLALFLSNQEKNPYRLKKIMYQLPQIMESYSDDDIYSELVIIFLELLDKHEFRDNTSFVHYVTKYMRWKIQKFISKVFRDPLNQSIRSMDDYMPFRSFPLVSTKKPVPIEDEIQVADFLEDQGRFNQGYGAEVAPSCLPMQQLDLSWISKPKSELFRCLTPYQRYLLVMKFGQGLSNQTIAEKLNRHRTTVRKAIAGAIEALKAYHKENVDLVGADHTDDIELDE
jgi:RNA polymerase sigma factor (sigma-70 family)